MLQMLKSSLVVLIMLLALVLVGCGEEPGPAEKAGKKVDRAMKKASDKIKDFSK